MVNYSLITGTAANFVRNSDIALVRYAYVTIGAIISVASVLYAVAYYQEHCLKREHYQKIPSTQQTTDVQDDTEISDNKPAERRCRQK